MVESGAFDGLRASNSFWLEHARGYACLLVEPNPIVAARLRANRRGCHVLDGGLSPTSHVASLDMQLGGEVTGIVSSQTVFNARHIVDRMAKKGSPSKPSNDVIENGNGAIVKVWCWPLAQVLRAIGRRDMSVDYLSLDTEGSEPMILDATLDHVEVGLLTVEWHVPSFPTQAGQRREAIFEACRKRGIELLFSGIKDDYYANRAYFVRRGLPFPTRKPPILCRTANCFAAVWRPAQTQEALGNPSEMQRLLWGPEAQLRMG